MDDFELPDDLKDSVEVVYLNDDECIEEHDMLQEEAEGDEDTEEEVIDLAKFTFKKHEKSVFCCDLTNNGTLAVTGGEDDMAYVWSTETGEILLECTGHKDSVTDVCFNFDSQYVATGDMSGLIQVWSIKDKKLIWCYEGDDLEWLLWHNLANVLVAGTKTGDVCIWQIPQGNCKVLRTFAVPSTCGKILPDGKKLLAGYGNGLVKLWDMKSNTMIWRTNVTDGLGITSLDVTSDGSLIAVAPTATLLKATDGKPVGQLLIQGESDVEALSFNTNLNVLITGSLSGQLCIWDIARNSLRHQAKIECAVTLLKWAQNYKLIIGATDGALYICDARTGTLIETLTGHYTEILSAKVSHDGTFILSTSDDGTAKIYTLK